MKRDDETLTEFAEELRRVFSGEVHVDRFTCLLYATDASIYQMDPKAVVVPRNHDDVAAAVSLAARFQLPILPRGAGTSLAGQTVGDAVVIDFTRHMNQILDVNREERCARVQPGVVLDQLNARVKNVGLVFGPDVSTSSRATMGGMIGNNSCGAPSVAYGLMSDHVRELRVVLAGGDEARFQELTAEQWTSKCALRSAEGGIYRTVDRLVGEHRDEIAARYPKILRHVGGYALDRLVSGTGRNLSRLIAGSEGTLATLTEAKVGLVPLPRVKALAIVHFGDLVAAMDAVEEILSLGPVAIELIDKNLLDLTRKQPAYASKMTSVRGDPAAILIVEFYGDSRDELRSKLERLERRLSDLEGPGPTVIAETPETQADVWAIRKAGLGMLSSIRGDIRPLAFVEDTAVPPRHLGSYAVRFQKILQAHGTRAGFYGHASAGCLHIRPMLNLKDPAQVRKMVDIAAAVKDLVQEFGGAMTGEHGDGLVRSHWNRELFGERLYSAFRQLKGAFDPASIMNPGKIVDAPPMTSHLRYGDGYHVLQPDTHLDFTVEGGLIGAVEQCTGLGACRKASIGTMCPSYRATREEEHSTRGRANALRLALTGRLGHEGFTSRRLYEALDLCLECKACKTECEANVDMAKLKSEFLAHYNARHGTPMRSQVFGNIAWVNRLGSATAPLSNWIVQSRLFRQTLQRMLGVDPRRNLPSFARPTFRRWLRDNPPRPPRQPGLKVVMFTDTFANFNETGVARAVLRLLESTGAEILIPELECCGRPMISKGMLAEAREKARHNVGILRPLVEAGAWVVGCEPSCMLTLRDEYPDLLRTEDARQVAARILLIEEFLVRQLDAGLWRPRFSNAPRTVLLHGHCHQKSLVGTSPSLRLLRLPPGFTVREIDAGCCGMAGTFGWECEHYALSMQIGETSLFPAVRQAPADADVVADGISCRLQIQHGTGRQARHMAEVLAGALEDANE